MISCSFPAMVRLYLRRYLESSMSMAPPPATTESFCIARLTIDGVVQGPLGLLHELLGTATKDNCA